MTLFAPLAAWAGQSDTPAPGLTPNTSGVEHAHDGGIIAGKVTSVNYRRSVIAVNRTEITVMPSTQIQGSDSGYRTITDVRPGMLVHVYTSLVDGKYIAQIITLK